MWKNLKHSVLAIIIVGFFISVLYAVWWISIFLAIGALMVIVKVILDAE